jgi:hypothetical protein
MKIYLHSKVFLKETKNKRRGRKQNYTGLRNGRKESEAGMGERQQVFAEEAGKPEIS